MTVKDTTTTTAKPDGTEMTAGSDIETGVPTAHATPLAVDKQQTTASQVWVAPPPPNTTARAPEPRAHASGEANCALICAIVGFFIFGIILGPIAVCKGVNAQKEIRANPGMTGECQAQSAIVLGVIDTIGSIILIIMIMGGGGAE